MDKEVVVHTHNGILLSYKKEHVESVLIKWMNLEPIIQTEVNQKEKDKYYILMHIYMEFRKILHARQQKRCKRKEQTFGLSGRR